MPASTVTFKWQNSPDHGSYVVYRDTVPFTESTLPAPHATLPSSQASFTDNVAAEQLYFYMFGVEEISRNRMVYSDIFEVRIKPNLYVCGGTSDESAASIRKITADAYISWESLYPFNDASQTGLQFHPYNRAIDYHDGEIHAISHAGNFGDQKIITVDSNGNILRTTSTIIHGDKDFSDVLMKKDGYFYTGTASSGLCVVPDVDGATYTFFGDASKRVTSSTIAPTKAGNVVMCCTSGTSPYDTYVAVVSGTPTAPVADYVFLKTSPEYTSPSVTVLASGEIVAVVPSDVGDPEVFIIDEATLTVTRTFVLTGASTGSLCWIYTDTAKPNSVWAIIGHRFLYEIDLSAESFVEVVDVFARITDSVFQAFITSDRVAYFTNEIGYSKYDIDSDTFEWYITGYSPWGIVAEPGIDRLVTFS